MAYKIFYTTKRGGGMVMTLPTSQLTLDKIKRLFKSKTAARAEKDSIIIGEVYKNDLNRWHWYFDTEV